MTVLKTFRLPSRVDGSDADITLGQAMIAAWQADGIFQIALEDRLKPITQAAFAASKRFFGLPMADKTRCVSDQTYAGYVASGEEITAGKADFSEIFTVCKDVPPNDPRARQKWPCHGPVPWPDEDYQRHMRAFMDGIGEVGERLLALVALGLDLEDRHALTDLTEGGWHHMRVLRFASEAAKQSNRGIGAHTDYGLLVIAAQDDVGGLYIRPPVEGEQRNRNWLPDESMAGMYEDEEPWTFVKPIPDVLTVFPGDVFQFMTGGRLLSTPHKVKLHPTRERYAIAYFHEPNFNACARPFNDADSDEYIHYGTHFTNMFMRCYPDRAATQRIMEENRLAVLKRLETRAKQATCSEPVLDWA